MDNSWGQFSSRSRSAASETVNSAITPRLDFILAVLVLGVGACGRGDAPTALRDPRGVILVVDGDRHSQIYAMRPDGSEIRQLTHNNVMNTDPALSPDGTQIAFISLVDSIPGFPARRPDVYVMNVDGSGVRRLYASPNTSWHPTWSPDGKHIAFTSVDPAIGDFRVYVMNSDGSNVHVVGNAPRGSFDPEWFPDGTRLLFLSNRSPRNWWTMYTMNVDGTGEQQLAGDNACNTNLGGARLSPDGNRIAYHCGSAGLYIIGADGAGTGIHVDTSIPANGTADGNPVWSPAGDQLAFSSNRESTFQESITHVYTVPVTGGVPTKITRDSRGWYPDTWGIVR